MNDSVLTRLEAQVADLIRRDDEKVAALANIAEGLASLLDAVEALTARLDA